MREFSRLGGGSFTFEQFNFGDAGIAGDLLAVEGYRGGIGGMHVGLDYFTTVGGPAVTGMPSSLFGQLIDTLTITLHNSHSFPYIDNIVFDTVGVPLPLPLPLVLMGFGLAGIAAWRR